jgi:hypothetical protein
MKCTNCGATIPEHARFCAGCGRALTGAAAAPASAPTSQTHSASKAKWWAIGVGVLLLMAIAFVVGTQSGLITRANVQAPEAPSVLEAQAPKVDAPSVLEAQPPKVDAPSVLETEAPKPPPKHVVDWLEHLRKTEERRRRLERAYAPAFSMLFQALAMRASPMKSAAEDDLDRAEEELERQREKLRDGYQQRQQEWAQLLQYFRSVPPPPECQTLADAYFAALSEYVNIILQIEKNFIENDLGVIPLLGSVQSDLNARFARADEELTRVCEQYGIRKDFSIAAQGFDLTRILGGGLPLGF